MRKWLNFVYPYYGIHIAVRKDKDFGWEHKIIKTLWKTIWRLLGKLKIELPYDPVVLFLGVYIQKNWKQDLTPSMFTAAFSTTAKRRKQPRCLSTDEWMNTMWYIWTMKYNLTLKRKEILPHATTWMNLENIMLSKISQSKRDRYKYSTYLR